MTDANKIDDRLREVEHKVVAISATLQHMPTTAELWKAVAVTSFGVIASLIGAGMWVVQQYLAPLLSASSG